MPDDHHSYGDVYDGATVLITGGAGFIGSHLAARLMSLDANVRVLDDLSTGHRSNLPPDGVRLFEGSILDDVLLREATTGAQFVFHLAAMVSVPLSVEQPQRCERINIAGTERVLEAARDAGVSRLVFASSSAVYGGDPNLPSRETDPIDCQSPYAASKAAGEALLSAFGCCYELSTVNLRYFNIFGPRQDPHSPYAAAIAAFHSALGSGRTPTVFGDGGQTRDFTYVDNVVHATLLAGACERDLRGERINIGTGRRVTLLDVIDALNDALNVEIEPTFGEPRAGDVRHSAPDLTVAREILGYEPIVDFEEGIRRMVDCDG